MKLKNCTLLYITHYYCKLTLSKALRLLYREQVLVLTALKGVKQRITALQR